MSSPERKFLHDLASPLTVAQGMLDTALDILRRDAAADPKLITKVEKSLNSLEKIADLLRQRRAVLVAGEAAGASGAPGSSPESK